MSHPFTAALVVGVADGGPPLDRRLKATIYARAGLREHWIRTVDLLRPSSYVTPLASPGVSSALAVPCDQTGDMNGRQHAGDVALDFHDNADGRLNSKYAKRKKRLGSLDQGPNIQAR